MGNLSRVLMSIFRRDVQSFTGNSIIRLLTHVGALDVSLFLFRFSAIFHDLLMTPWNYNFMICAILSIISSTLIRVLEPAYAAPIFLGTQAFANSGWRSTLLQ